MKTVITQSELAQADLRPYTEIWLTSPTAVREAGHTEDELCLWRANQVFSHDMLSEGTHGQNVMPIWLVLDNIDDPDQVLGVETMVRERLLAAGLDGEFYPAEVGERTDGVK
jgi:hypothetical protein